MHPVSTKKSLRYCRNHNSWEQQEVAAAYSASIVDMITKCCFLVAQDTKQGPRKLAIPKVLFLSTKKPAQSASTYPMKSKLHPWGHHKAKSGVCFKYLKILLTTFKCVSLGLDWKRTHKPTLKAMSGLLVVRYRSYPIMPLSYLSLAERLPSSITNLVEGEMRVSMGLANSIPNRFINSLTYFC